MTNILKNKKYKWLITGVAGFIGSHLLEFLLSQKQSVIGLDNLSTGSQKNLEDVKKKYPRESSSFDFYEADISNLSDCLRATENIDFILHHAALASVPQSITNPLETHQTNVTGFLNILEAAKKNKVKRIIYASSSAVYGDEISSVKVEDKTGNTLSLYAASKFANELYAKSFYVNHGLESIGLRYFNIFGPRQDPNGAYAAVIPQWIFNLLQKKPCVIYGDGKTTRDFCYVDNVVVANIQAALMSKKNNFKNKQSIYNIAMQYELSLNSLYKMIRESVSRYISEVSSLQPVYQNFRAGDVRFSCANIHKAKKSLQYKPVTSLEKGLNDTVDWYIKYLNI